MMHDLWFESSEISLKWLISFPGACHQDQLSDFYLLEILIDFVEISFNCYIVINKL